jgi:hypothetical protein
MVASKKKAKRPAEPDPDDLFIERTDQLHELANLAIEACLRIRHALQAPDFLEQYSTAQLVRETDAALLVVERTGIEVRIALHMLVRAARRARG